MDQTENVAAPRSWWNPRKFPERFDHAVVLILNGIIMIVIVMALVSLTVKVVASLMVPGSLDPTDHAVFQTIFGMIFTVILLSNSGDPFCLWQRYPIASFKFG